MEEGKGDMTMGEDLHFVQCDRYGEKYRERERDAEGEQMKR